jgi:hypothetical protein
MPPRKSNASNASADATGPAPLTGAQVQQAAAEKSGYSIEVRIYFSCFVGGGAKD